MAEETTPKPKTTVIGKRSIPRSIRLHLGKEKRTTSSCFYTRAAQWTLGLLCTYLFAHFMLDSPLFMHRPSEPQTAFEQLKQWQAAEHPIGDVFPLADMRAKSKPQLAASIPQAPQSLFHVPTSTLAVLPQRSPEAHSSVMTHTPRSVPDDLGALANSMDTQYLAAKQSLSGLVNPPAKARAKKQKGYWKEVKNERPSEAVKVETWMRVEDVLKSAKAWSEGPSVSSEASMIPILKPLEHGVGNNLNVFEQD